MPMRFTAGDNAVLTVETKSATPSIVTWLKENKPLDDRLADRVKIVSKENVHSLTLLNASDEDSGLYTAKCSNQYGTTCSSGFINVHECKLFFSLTWSTNAIATCN